MSAWPYKVIDLEGTRHLETTLNKLVADGYDIETIHSHPRTWAPPCMR